MNITLNIQTETAAELATAIHSLAGILPPQVTGSADITVVPTEPPAAKPEKKKQKTPEAKEDAAPAENAENDEKIGIEQVREAAMKVKEKLGLPKVQAVLEELGVNRVVDLQPKQYASFLEKLPAI